MAQLRPNKRDMSPSLGPKQIATHNTCIKYSVRVGIAKNQAVAQLGVFPATAGSGNLVQMTCSDDVPSNLEMEGILVRLLG
jgi:hypothetical protein